MIAQLDGRGKPEEDSRRLQRVSYRTPWGTGTVVMEGCRLVSVELPASAASSSSPVAATSAVSLVTAAPEATGAPPASDVRASPDAEGGIGLEADPSCAERWVTSLEAYFSGERSGWTSAEVPLEELEVGEFERAVYAALLTVPPAVTVSYGILADMAGYPRAARAVGNAMAANPWPVVIPCHRVIRSDGTLGRYGDDPSWKPRLLEHEALHLRRTS